jgi:hypothetical protein
MSPLKPVFILFSALLVSLQLSAQSHDADGYYIGLKGDTVFGKFPGYAEYSNSPAKVPFQPSNADEPITLTPDSCLKFSAGHGESFISYTGKRLANATNYQNATSDNIDVYTDVSVFIRELFNDGHYRLYELKDSKRSNFYISGDTTPLRELYYKEYIEYNNDNNGVDNNKVVESPVFKQQLKTFFMPIINTNFDLERRITSTPCSSGGLTNLFAIMTTGKAVKTKRKYPTQVFVGLGESSNTLKVTLVNAIGGTGSEGAYSTQVSPVFEAGVRLFSQRNYGRLFFMFRANYYQFQNSNKTADPFDPTIVKTTYGSSVLSFPISVGYKFINSPDFSLEGSAGASLLILSNNNETQLINPGPLETSIITSDSRSNAFSLFGEAAIVLFKKISVYAGYYSPCSISSSQIYNPVHTSFKYGVRYLF